MRRLASFPASIVAAAALVVCDPVCGKSADLPELAVLAYNLAAIPDHVLRGAKTRVSDILLDAGVHVVWVERQLEPQLEPAIARDPFENFPHVFCIRIVIRSRRIAPSLSATDSVMGQAREGGEASGTSAVFFDEVRVVSDKSRVTLEAMLAFVMAHEMGHLLLPRPAHSTTGIMRDKWRPEEMRYA